MLRKLAEVKIQTKKIPFVETSAWLHQVGLVGSLGAARKLEFSRPQ